MRPTRKIPISLPVLNNLDIIPVRKFRALFWKLRAAAVTATFYIVTGIAPYLLQSGTANDNVCNAVAVGPNGAALLVGWTEDEFLDTATTNDYIDFATVLIETGTTAALIPAPETPSTPSSPLAPALTSGEEESSSALPLWPVIEGSVGALALLAVVGSVCAVICRSKQRCRGVSRALKFLAHKCTDGLDVVS